MTVKNQSIQVKVRPSALFFTTNPTMSNLGQSGGLISLPGQPTVSENTVTHNSCTDRVQQKIRQVSFFLTLVASDVKTIKTYRTITIHCGDK